MTYIPKTQEPEYQRQLKAMREKIDQLAESLERVEKRKAAEVQLPAAQEAVPNAVAVALGYVARFQHTTLPQLAESDVAVEAFCRNPADSELAALDSACELIEDYFDRHNSRVLRERQRAELAAKHKPTGRAKSGALPVTYEDEI